MSRVEQSNVDLEDSNTNNQSGTLSDYKDVRVAQDIGADEAVSASLAALQVSLNALQVNAVSVANAHTATLNHINQRNLNNAASYDADLNAQKLRHVDHTLSDLHG